MFRSFFLLVLFRSQPLLLPQSLGGEENPFRQSRAFALLSRCLASLASLSSCCVIAVGATARGSSISSSRLLSVACLPVVVVLSRAGALRKARQGESWGRGIGQWRICSTASIGVGASVGVPLGIAGAIASSVDGAVVRA